MNCSWVSEDRFVHSAIHLIITIIMIIIIIIIIIIIMTMMMMIIIIVLMIVLISVFFHSHPFPQNLLNLTKKEIFKLGDAKKLITSVSV